MVLAVDELLDSAAADVIKSILKIRRNSGLVLWSR